MIMNHRHAWSRQFRVDQQRMLFAAKRLLPDHRVARCHAWKWLAHMDEDAPRTIYSCSSVWSCPVCAGIIASRSRTRLRPLAQGFMAHGGGACYITTTFKHSSKDDLNDLLDRWSQARRDMHATWGYKELMKQAGKVGSVRSLEMTVGPEGWHVHTHDLLFIDQPFKLTGRGNTMKLNEFHRKYQHFWRKSARKFGLVTGKNSIHIVLLKAESFSGRWDIVAELVNLHQKAARPPNKSPMQLLHAYMSGDEAAGIRFKEYSEAVFARNRIVWSDGLERRLLAIATPPVILPQK